MVLVASALASQAQEKIKYEILKDDPSDLPWIVVNLDIFGMEVTKPKNDFGTNFGIGIWGQVEIPKLPIAAQYAFYRSYFDAGQLLQSKDFPQTTDVQLGAAYFLSDKTKTRDIGIGLASKVVGSEKYTRGNKSYEKTTTQNTSISLPGQVRKQFGPRAGFIFRGSGIPLGEGLGQSVGISSKKPYEYTKHNSTSIYGGLTLRTTTNLVIKTDKYGIASTASKSTSWFVDAIVSPINTFKHPSGDDINQLVKDSLSGSPVGFRIGYQTNAIEKRAVTGKKFGMSVRGDLGYRPYTGWYGMATIGLTLIKIHK